MRCWCETKAQRGDIPSDLFVLETHVHTAINSGENRPPLILRDLRRDTPLDFQVFSGQKTGSGIGRAVFCFVIMSEVAETSRTEIISGTRFSIFRRTRDRFKNTIAAWREGRNKRRSTHLRTVLDVVSLLETEMAKISGGGPLDGSPLHQAQVGELLPQVLDGIGPRVRVVKVLGGWKGTPSGRQHFRLVRENRSEYQKSGLGAAHLVIILLRRLQRQVLEPAGARVGARVEVLLVHHRRGWRHICAKTELEIEPPARLKTLTSVGPLLYSLAERRIACTRATRPGTARGFLV